MSYALDEPLAYSPWADSQDERERSTPCKPLSGPGTSRQTRRLQLRNAGFRGAAVPSRKVTPKITSSSSSIGWQSTSGGIMSGSDAENFSPMMGGKATSVKVGKKRTTSGVLTEVGDVNILTRPKTSRPRVTSSFFSAANTSRHEGFVDDVVSPPPVAKNSLRAKSVRARAKMNKTRRSVSGESRMYIDHLESELAQAQEQLRMVNSPSVARQQSSKMRTLNAETRQSQDELAEWEARYEQRVQEILDEHIEVETDLRKQVRNLEQIADESRYRVQELEIEVESVRQAAETTETANVNLERRLEIMSGMLATSPTKVDLHAVTPGMHNRHRRPKSMLPRFPTASSLAMSPEKQPQTQPPSPMLTFTDFKAGLPEGFDASLSQSDMLSDAESVFSEAGITNGGSVTSIEPPEAANINPWTLQALQSAKSRPARRMRRFGPGSHGPRPLILPSTSQYEPTSAPPLERSETAPILWPSTDDELFSMAEEDSPSSLVLRRRASTTADQATLDHLAASPFRHPSGAVDGRAEESLLSSRCPASTFNESEATPKDFSSLGSVAGQNLMDELCAVGTNEMSEEGGEEVSASGREAAEMLENLDMGEEEGVLACGQDEEEGIDVHSLLISDDTIFPVSRRERENHGSRSGTSTPEIRAPSTYRRLRLLFSDLWRSPVALAQHLVQSTQSRFRIPAPLRNVQWWLVGVLLGPIAKHRFLSSHCPPRQTCQTCSNEDLETQPLLRAYTAPSDNSTSPNTEEAGLAYGTMFHSTPPFPNSSAKNKNRSRDRTCPHQGLEWSRHSPWMWLKFSITLAFAVGVAFKDGPASLLRKTVCGCREKASRKLSERREDDGASV